MSGQKSFTLIELLIVIGILAVLVAAIVITLNPAQLLAQARDSKRQQDLSALNQALNTITTLDQSLFMGTSSIVYTSLPDSSSTCGSWGLPTLPSGWQYHCSPTSSL
ncbi:MAG: type II secretion system protein, partial [Candidatus Paceibacterota bacterium]